MYHNYTLFKIQFTGSIISYFQTTLKEAFKMKIMKQVIFSTIIARDLRSKNKPKCFTSHTKLSLR